MRFDSYQSGEFYDEMFTVEGGVRPEAKTLVDRIQSLEDAQDMVSIFSNSFGSLGTIVFGVGFWGAVFSTYVGANTGYPLLIADIYHKFIRNSDTETRTGRSDPAFRWLVIFSTSHRSTSFCPPFVQSFASSSFLPSSSLCFPLSRSCC